MRIGIFADTHDNLRRVEKAVRVFNNNNVGFVLHAGDFIAPFVIPKLKGLKCDWAGVFGNNDGEKNGLSAISEGKIKEGPLRIKLDNKEIVLVHDINTINPDNENASLVVFGHLHKPQVLKKANKLLINPGECGGWLYGKSTLAIVDLESLSAKILKI